MWPFKILPTVSVTEAKQKVGNAGVAFIDVRTPEEYAAGHAVGALNMPLDTLNEAAAAHLKQFTQVYAICGGGGRSSTAVSKLLEANVNAINIEGGTSAWRERSLPIV